MPTAANLVPGNTKFSKERTSLSFANKWAAGGLETASSSPD
jgi:hypothetical protein